MIKKTKFFDSALLFLIPGLAGFILFYIFPFIISFVYSLYDSPVKGSFTGIQNYIDLFQNRAYIRALKNTLIFTSIAVPLNIILSLGAALIINQIKRYKAIFTLIFLIPLVIPSGSMVFFWQSFFAVDGYLNNILFQFGIAPKDWLGTELARYVIIFIYTWKNMGYNIILFLSGLSSIPTELYEAAKVDGANKFQEFRNITVVFLMPVFFMTFLISIINSFKVFREIYLITGSYPHESIYMLQHFMNNMFSSLNYSRLTTATTVLVIIMAVVTSSLYKLERKSKLW